MAVSSAKQTTNGADRDRPIDLVHLGVQTQGDSELEREILSIFTTQSRAYVEIVRNNADRSTQKRAAHSLKGASRSIGAFTLADWAQKLEDDPKTHIKQAEKELENVLGFIASLS